MSDRDKLQRLAGSMSRAWNIPGVVIERPLVRFRRYPERWPEQQAHQMRIRDHEWPGMWKRVCEAFNLPSMPTRYAVQSFNAGRYARAAR